MHLHRFSAVDLFVLLWVGFAVSWIAAAAWRSAAVRTVPLLRSLPYRALLLVGAVLLNHRASVWFGSPRLWPMTREWAMGLALLMVPGFGFAWWARVHLGALWSGAITRKPDHRVVDTGPYGLVRHPIYTGILWAVACSAAAVGTAVGLVGFGMIVAGFWVKARMEERFLAEELGAGPYGSYRTRVPMLVPFWPVRRA